MRNRSRLLLLLAPWLSGVPRDGFAQANTNVPGGGSGQEQGEVQVGAGTQGDVTTGSSGTKAKSGGDGAKKGSEARKAGKSPVPSEKAASERAPASANAGARGAEK